MLSVATTWVSNLLTARTPLATGRLNLALLRGRYSSSSSSSSSPPSPPLGRLLVRLEFRLLGPGSRPTSSVGCSFARSVIWSATIGVSTSVVKAIVDLGPALDGGTGAKGREVVDGSVYEVIPRLEVGSAVTGD